MKRQIRELKRSKQKKVSIDPNETFASIEDIHNAEVQIQLQEEMYRRRNPGGPIYTSESTREDNIEQFLHQFHVLEGVES